MQLIVQGLVTSYSESGKGDKFILCLHGWGDSAISFAALSERLEDYRVLALDLPGFGKTAPPKNPWRLEDYALFVADFQRKLELQLHAVVGHSNGGAIAVVGVSAGFIKTDNLVLLASSGIRRPNTFRNTALKLVAKSGKLVVHLAPKNTKSQLKKRIYRKIGSDYLVAEHMQETFKLVVAQDVLDAARDITIPTCIVYGDQDHSTPQVYGALFADAIKGSELHVVGGAGHFLHHDQTSEVAQIVRKFL